MIAVRSRLTQPYRPVRCGLFLRLACHTADWPTGLEHSLPTLRLAGESALTYRRNVSSRSPTSLSIRGERMTVTRVVGLLRGVNLGPSRRLKMADLRAVVESLGHTDVATYLQSGNVVFTPRKLHPALGDEITDELEAATGVRSNILTRTGAEMAAIVAANPYAREDPTKVVVTFLAAPKPAATGGLDPAAFAPEGMTLCGCEVYLDLPFGQARSPLLTALAKAEPDDGRATSRNWRTVMALREMSA
jgi:uncharacterized protein (DUF1697 family)